MKNFSSIIFIVVAIGIFFVFIDPQYKEVKALLITKQENDVLLDKARDLRQKRQQLTDKYNAISEADRAKLNKVLPETVDNVRLILDIDNIAQRSGINLRGISISGDINQEEETGRVIDRTTRKYGVISLSFSFTTDYTTMKKFLSELENSLRVVDIRELSVSAPEIGNAYSYSLKLDTYWLR